ncbi:L-threonylcarbamoyladenylate synthase [Candidatus Aenigmatarchaeota archaeon]
MAKDNFLVTGVVKINETVVFDKAIDVLSKGGIIIYPTETSYGMGVDASNKKAMKALYTTKKMSQEKKISVACANTEMVETNFKLNEAARKLLMTFLPGPLTLICDGKSFRIPDDIFVIALVKKFGKPITATSANISGEDDIYSIDKIRSTLDGKVDLIIDAGLLRKNKPSTVFDTNSMKVLRKGPITEEEIMNALR